MEGVSSSAWVLTWFSLYCKELSGEIPSEIGNMLNLVGLLLYQNQLTGEIPPEIWNLLNLSNLSLGGNQLTGEIPPDVGNLINLTWLYLSGNQLSGEIPDSICILVENDCGINISTNQLCPPYPECLTEEDIGNQDTLDCINIGDLNGDLEINVSDIIILVNLILDDDYNEYGDIDLSGELNIFDIIQLVNLILDN